MQRFSMTVTSTFLRFLVVGTVGFAIDGGLVWMLVSDGLNPLVTRCFSFPSAVIVTWWLNRIWTFATGPNGSKGRQISAYFAVQIVGALTNLCVYAMLLLFIESTALNVMIAFTFGSIIGLFVNFTGSKRFVFAPALPIAGNQVRD